MIDFDEIAEAQGWNQSTMLMVVRGFVSTAGLNESLAEYAKDIAETENQSSDWQW